MEPNRSRARAFFLAAALAMAAVIPLLGLPVYFRTDDVHWLGWAIDHANPLAAFDPGQNLFGYYRPVPTLAWWGMFRLFGFEPLGYQLVLGLVAILAMIPLFRIGERLGGGAWAGLLAVTIFHAGFFTILYYVYWFSAFTFGLDLLFLLLALERLLRPDFPRGWPGFVVFALLAGMSKQPALLILPVVGTGLLMGGERLDAGGAAGGAGTADHRFPARRRLGWIAGLWAMSFLLLAVTPFVVNRPETLAGMSRDTLLGFMRERYLFYAGTLLRSPAGMIVAAAGTAAVFRRLFEKSDGRSVAAWGGLALGGVLGLALRGAPLAIAFPAWVLLILAAAVAVPASRPWVAGFFVPLAALLGVDFHVATYLLEPAVILVPALVLWVAPVLVPAGAAVSRLAGRLPKPAGVFVPLAATALLAVVVHPRVTAVATMRDVRATFRQAVDRIVTSAPKDGVIGSLTYDELGETYAEIRNRPLERRVEQHKTMNPAQLEKFLRLRGRGDLKVMGVAEALATPAPGGRMLFAMSAEERDVVASLPGATERVTFQRGEVMTALFGVEDTAGVAIPGGAGGE